MKVVDRTKTDYAHIQFSTEDQSRIDELRKSVLVTPLDALKGLQIEVSESDLVPEDVRGALKDGRFYLVE